MPTAVVAASAVLPDRIVVFSVPATKCTALQQQSPWTGLYKFSQQVHASSRGLPAAITIAAAAANAARQKDDIGEKPLW